MIPEYLIKKFESGEAVYKTLALGGGGAYNIPVPENKYIVIFHFQFFPMFQKALAPGEAPTPFYNFVNGIQFQSSSGRRWRYNHRSSAITTNISGQAVTTSPLPPAEFNCYQFHDQNVNINVVNHFPPQAWISVLFANTIANKGSNIEKEPNGYGLAPSGVSCVQRIFFSFADRINPIGSQVTDENFPQEFWQGVNSFTGLIDYFNVIHPNLPNTEAQFAYPLINVSYALFNEPENPNHR